MSFKQKMESSSKRTGSRIVLALDFPPKKPSLLLSESLRILEAAYLYVCAVKLNHHLILPLGLFNEVQKILKLSRDYGLPTIMDCKINDIGDTNHLIAHYYYEAGFDAVIANPFVGWEEGLQPVFKLAKKMERGVILLVYMSHKGSLEGYGQTIVDKNKQKIPQYVLFAQKALKWNADGVVVGATYPDKIKEVYSIVSEKVPIYSPGIGAQGGRVEDAVKAGTKFLIVGRAITLADEPSEVAKSFRDKACFF